VHASWLINHLSAVKLVGLHPVSGAGNESALKSNEYVVESMNMLCEYVVKSFECNYQVNLAISHL